MNTRQQEQNTILFNNKNILIGGKPVFYREWFAKGIQLNLSTTATLGTEESGRCGEVAVMRR